MNNPLNEKNGTTERGFQFVEFNDLYEKRSSIQQSSIALNDKPGTSAIWIGLNGVHWMHLDTHRVKWLIQKLQKWVDTGDFF